MDMDCDFSDELLLLQSYVNDNSDNDEDVKSMFSQIWKVYTGKVDLIDFKLRQHSNIRITNLNNLKRQTSKFETVYEGVDTFNFPKYIITPLGYMYSVCLNKYNRYVLENIPDLPPNLELYCSWEIDYEAFPHLHQLKYCIQDQVLKNEAIETWENKYCKQNERLRQEINIRMKDLLQLWLEFIRKSSTKDVKNITSSLSTQV